MFTDTVNEFFIERKRSAAGTVVRKVLILLGCIILCAIAIFFTIADFIFAAAAALVVIGSVILCIFQFRPKSTEYEYSFLTGDMSIDRIVNKEKRKPIFTMNVKNIEQMGLYSKESFERENGSVLIDASSGSTEPKSAIYIKASSSNMTETGKVKLGGGNVYVILENDERVRKAIKPYIRASVYREGMKDAE